MESPVSPSMQTSLKMIAPPEGIRRKNIEGADLVDFCVEEVGHTFQPENDNNHYESESKEKQDVITTENNPTHSLVGI